MARDCALAVSFAHQTREFPVFERRMEFIFLFFGGSGLRES
jgi:hypothetical protein